MAEKKQPSFLPDKIIHERARLIILTYLASSEKNEISFTELSEKLELSRGNLSVQLKTLKEVSYINVIKRFVDNKPLTTAFITEIGRSALERYISEMEKLLSTFRK